MFTKLAEILYEPISFFMGSFFSSRVDIPVIGSIVLMGLPYFILCLIIQYIITSCLPIKYRNYFFVLVLFFSQMEILLIFKKNIKKLSDENLFLLLVLGFCTMSSGVSTFYKYNYFYNTDDALGGIFFSQIVSYAFAVLLVPIYFKNFSVTSINNLFPTDDRNDFLGFKGLFETLVGAFIGLIFIVSVVRFASVPFDYFSLSDPLCLGENCESSFLFNTLVDLLEKLLIFLGFGVDSLKMAYIVTKSVLFNEKEAFFLMSKTKFLNREHYLILISIISNFINIYVLGFCIGILTFWVRKIDRNLILLCLKSFIFSFLIKVLSVMIVSVRLLI